MLAGKNTAPTTAASTTDPSSTALGSAGAGNASSTTAPAYGSTAATGTSAADGTTYETGMPGAFANDDDASTTAIRHGVAGTDTTGTSSMGTTNEAPIRHDVPGLDAPGNVDKPLPSAPATATGVPGQASNAAGSTLPDRTADRSATR